MSKTVSTSTHAAALGRGMLDRWASARIAARINAMHSGVRLVDGGVEQAPRGEVWVQVRHPRAYRRVLAGGTIGAAEAYMDGDWDTNDLAGLCGVFARNADAMGAIEGWPVRLAMPLLRLANAARRNTRRGSRRNIAAHYDLGNAFYAEWLDKTMTYSSAYFAHAHEDLAAASVNKLERMCRMLELRREDHVLEIGGGWGSFAVHAAERYGCRVTTTTISREQHAHLVARVAAAGLSDRVTVLLEDYRDLRGTYDKIASIEMIEAVGAEYLETFLAKCAALLKPDGRLALQAILIRDQQYRDYLRSVDFIRKYIFPGGSLPSASVILDAAARATDLGLVALDDMTPHYALTLRRWRERFMDRAAAIRAQGFDERFMRMWEFYLAYCEAGFAERLTTCAQMVFARRGFRSRVEGVA